MLNPKSSSAALPIAYVVLRVLIVANWLYGAGVLALLLIMLFNEPWIMLAFKIPVGPDTERLRLAMRVIAVLGLAAVPLNYVVLTRLRSIVETVRAGDPFVVANAQRLQTISWMLVGLNVLSIVIGAIADVVSTPERPFHLDAGFSINGWLAVLLTFVLARVFAVGAVMREDLEGTV